MDRRQKPLLKIILLGDSGVGKTSLMKQYVHKRFTHVYKATIGADFYLKDVSLDGKSVTLQIWDTVGQERFQSLGVAFYRGADCVVLVYDVTSPTSYHALEMWKDEFLIHRAPRDPKNFPIVVIGNKIDLENKFNCKTKIQDMMMCDYKVPFFLTSAKDGTNIDEAFKMVAKMAMSQERDEYMFNTIPEVVVNHQSQKWTNKCSC